MDNTTLAAATSTLRGYAWWLVSRDGSLESFPGVEWELGWTEARCRLYPKLFRTRWHRLHPAGVPGAFCMCGFRGSRVPQPAGPGPRLSARLHSGCDELLFGAVEGAGSIMQDRMGWRAQLARPLAIYAAPERMRIGNDRIGRAAARYGLPVVRDFDAFVSVWGPPVDADATRSA